MIKTLIKSAIIGVSIFALVGAANAEVNINIYGASAQYKFWNDAADDFLLSKGCTSIQQAAGNDTYGTKKHGITTGDCSGETWYIRYSARASFDGIRAMQCIDPDNVSPCTNKCERQLADETNTDWSGGVVQGLACKDVTIGASDVEAGAFQQESHGQVDGHLGGGWVDRVMDSSTIYDTGLGNYRPIVVPFAFFKHNSVPFTNLSRMMAVHLFSGQIDDWQDFDPSVSSLPVTLCMRHAGSGTHATLDAAVMAGGGNLMIYEWPSAPVAWFNESSSDLMACVDAFSGAVGYADADKNAGGDYPNAVLLDYQGVSPVKANIVNGQYPFWAAQWLFVDSVTPGSPEDQLATWAAVPANMPASRAPYWAAQQEMKVTKANSFTFPTRK